MMNLNLKQVITICAMLLLTFYVNAQTQIGGTVTDESGEPLIGASIVVKGTATGTVTDLDGKFEFSAPQALPFVVVISYTGFNPEEINITESKTDLSISLLEGILIGQEIVVSASRKREKVQEAPASISVLGARQLAGTPQADPIRNLVNTPGVQIQQQSAARINIEMRASSGIFGTSVFPILDYRSLVGPGLGTFQSDQSGVSTIDLERIEVIRGPGSALYGPGVTSGVVHFISKNPIDHPGTTIQVGGGELSTFISSVRHAGANANKTFGYKINANFNRGGEFNHDPNDPDDAAFISTFFNTITRPSVTNNIVDVSKPGEVVLTENDLDPDGDGNVIQDHWWNASFNGTLEFRPQDDLSIFVAGGFNTASSVFYNDLGVGLAQAQEFWGQARMQKGGLFAQLFYVDNDGGKGDSPTFGYQTGLVSSLARTQLEGQLQYNFQTPDFLNADWTAGVDFRQATFDTKNLVYGRQENDDDYRIFGGYLQGKFALSDKLDMVLAGRYDGFNFLDEGFFSPRVAFVFKPDPKHTFRATFNRAGAPPTGLEVNIDFPVQVVVPGLLDFWLIGQKNTQQFSQDAVIDVTLPGIPDIPFGTPGLPLAIPFGAVNEGTLEQLIPGLLANPQTAPLAPAIEAFLRAYTPGGVTGALVGVNAFENNSLLNELIPTNEPTISRNNTFEIGYKGLFADKLGVTLDVYRITRSGFSDFTQIGPLVTLQGADIPNDLGAQVTMDINAFLVETLTPQIGAEAAAATAAQIAPLVGGAYTAGGQGFVDAVNAQSPALLGSIFGAVESDQVPSGDGVVHVPAGYRIFPDAELTYYGIDFGLEYYFSSDFSIWGNLSWVSETEFRGADLGVAEDSPLTSFLNSPQTKFRIGAIYAPAEKWRANISFQHDDGFFANTGQFGGDIQEKNLVDAGIGYQFSNGLGIDLIGNNIFDTEYRAFNNMPRIGRRILAKVTYTFGAKDD